MKNYSLTKEESKKFIKKYKIIDDNLIIYLGNGKKDIIPFSKIEEQNILKKMEFQALNNGDFKNKMFNKIMLNSGIIICLTGLLSICFILNYIIPLPMLPIILGIVISYTITITKLIKLNKYSKDLQKTDLYITNSNFNNITNKNIDKVTNNISKKAKKCIDERKNTNNIFNINSIDNMSLKDLKMVLKNLESLKYDCNEKINQDEIGFSLKKKKF